jgi:hypothetical protein
VEYRKNILRYDYDKTILNTVQILSNLIYLLNDCFISTGVLQQADQLKEVHTHISLINVYGEIGYGTFRYLFVSRKEVA